MVTAPRHCQRCGTALVDREIEGRTRRYCRQCETPVYRNPKPCAGVLVVDDRERVLLVKRTNPPGVGTWSLPAGYLEADEPPKRGAVRELREETGLRTAADALELFETTFVRNPQGFHVLVVVYVTTRSATTGTVEPGSDAGGARFWELSALAASDEEIEPGYDELVARAVDAVGGLDS